MIPAPNVSPSCGSGTGTISGPGHSGYMCLPLLPELLRTEPLFSGRMLCGVGSGEEVEKVTRTRPVQPTHRTADGLHTSTCTSADHPLHTVNDVVFACVHMCVLVHVCMCVVCACVLCVLCVCVCARMLCVCVCARMLCVCARMLCVVCVCVYVCVRTCCVLCVCVYVCVCACCVCVVL